MDVNRTPSDSLKDEILTSYRCGIAVFKRFAYQLVYISEAETPIEPNQFEDLLVVSRARNQIKHLTAMLVACDLQFLQVLEGNPADVIATFDRIALDPSHENLIVLHRGYSSVGRTFAAPSASPAATADLVRQLFVLEQVSEYRPVSNLSANDRNNDSRGRYSHPPPCRPWSMEWANRSGRY
jgi:hypothetical protein